jgi:hypothetical protein
MYLRIEIASFVGWQMVRPSAPYVGKVSLTIPKRLLLLPPGHSLGHRPRVIRPRHIVLSFLTLAVPAGAQQQSLGIFGLWGAFSQETRCYAISRPQQPARPAATPGYASVGWWPAQGVKGQVHFRFGQPKRPGSAVLLRIDDRTFQLIGGGTDAWAPDSKADAEIVAAMRTGLDMSVETRSERGALIRDVYRLRGAATALDAAAIACAPRR